jgi:hypothetical protein
MKGDKTEALLVFCAGKERVRGELVGRFGEQVDALVKAAVRDGRLCRRDEYHRWAGRKIVYQTTPKGAEWVFAHRAKKAKVAA